MDHFQIIQALTRSALPTGGAAVRNQVERLKQALADAGETRQAQSLAKLLANSAKAAEMAPSKLTQSRHTLFSGEELSKNTPLPVDRETASPLADVLFPEQIKGDMPLLDSRVAVAAKALLSEWSKVEDLLKLGVEPARSCLIYGAPGTGKTSLAIWLAKQLNLPIVLARLDGLISSFLGTTARNVGALFAFANRYKCVLVLDEFDAVAKVRDDPNEVGEIKRVVNALLQNIDSRRETGITIAITNHEQLLDPAIWRRFELQLKIPKPSFEGRVGIIEKYLSPISLDDRVKKLVAWITKGFSGAEIEVFVNGYKKYLALSGDTPDNIIPALQYLLTVSGEKVSRETHDLLMLEPPHIAAALASIPDLALSRADIAQLLNKDKTTIGRWLKTA
ncbi:AAA family ATPase [Pseudomonas capeferrum]|uniref:AAA family ATPase n=1 Tax=Pseudomonas capeferrum TaxID=1495066 RepID=UPI00097BCBF8|nr:ATP-binding protein [Pseudomonas capeferrum]MCH7298909.1 AAA family ATPase [Pseudomonas capeferrum]